MKIESVKLSQVKVNAENPRTITGEKFNKLINSLLVLPKMLELRPIVVDGKMCAIGGNMRTNALREIAKMSIEQIADRLLTISDFVEKTVGERKVLVEYWHQWLDNPTALIINASELSAEERKQFMIKDNASFGQWDYDALANKWDNAKLDDWGLDVWNANPAAFAPMGASTSTPSPTPSAPDASEEDGGNYSRKVVAPTYEPSGKVPAFREMCDTAKRDELVSEIRRADLPDDLRAFLVDAAQRHVVFNYEKIADYYAAAPADVQHLMERSALVIIDFEKAIGGGYVVLTQQLAEAYGLERGIDGATDIETEEGYDEE